MMIGGDGRLSRLDPCTGDAVLLTSMEVGPTAAIGGGFVYTPSVDSVWRVPLELGNPTFVTPSPPSSFVQQGVGQALLIETAPPAGLIRATRLDDQQVLQVLTLFSSSRSGGDGQYTATSESTPTLGCCSSQRRASSRPRAPRRRDPTRRACAQPRASAARA